ncbi:GNAT family N-acetyltransferase [Chloroflexota bacterium]
MPEIERVGYIPGIIGKITELHGTYYDYYWDMGVGFEARVASGLADFFSRFDPTRDGMWILRADGQIVGALAIDGIAADDKGARLRWFIIEPQHQGLGLGDRMFKEALGFCKKLGFRKIYLTTFAGLDAARHLYEKAGFSLVEEKEGNHWGKIVIEQVFELDL